MSVCMPIGPTESSVPRITAPRVERPRLQGLLDQPRRRPVTLITAPPGTGKTTLLASWASTQPAGTVGWIAVEPGHNDPGRFERALRSELDEAALDDAGPPSLHDAVARSTRQVVVIDDAHELVAPGALSVLARLLDLGGTDLDVVLATRSDLPIRTGRLRLEGRLRTVGTGDLRFSTGEAGSLFEQYGISLGRDDVAFLQCQTEGWAAALTLVALVLQEVGDPHRFARDPAATLAAVSEYVDSEVLAHLDGPQRQFLLRTSVVDQINADLATLLSGDQGGGRRLAAAERQGLFLTGIEGGSWYRYHALVRSLLRARLHQQEPTLWRALHQAAADWFDTAKMADEAEHHAIAAEDWTLLGRLVSRRWLDGVRRGDCAAVTLSSLPEASVLASPALAAVSAGVRAATGGATRAEAFAQALDDEAEPDARPGGDTAVTDEEATAVLVARVLGGCAFGADRQSVLAVQRLTMPDVDPLLRDFALARRVELLLDRGDLTSAKLLLRQRLQGAAGPWSRREAEPLLALVLALRGQAGAAQRLLINMDDGRPHQTAVAQHALVLAGCLVAAQTGEARDHRPPDALEALGPLGSRALTVCREAVSAASQERAWLDAGAARHPLASRVLVAMGVVEVTDNAGITLPVGGPPEAAVRRARKALVDRAARTALSALEPWAYRPAAEMHPRTLVELETLQAVTYRQLGDTVAANPHLAVALDVALETGTLAPLVDNARHLEPLLAVLATNPGRHQALALRLVDAPLPSLWPAFVEPLTDREEVVLKFLPTMMSNAEIASVMNVSVNTVKTHLKALYRKLGVDRRRDAVLRARQRQLL
jgi:LuxR family transcriptional regulator, maltose regulon positive regulatory protein